MSRSGRGFSLLEVILVVGIVALLAGIAYAVMGPARESARTRVCVSNLQQVSQALRMYISDYDGAEPVEGAAMEYWQLGLPPLGAVHSFAKGYVKNRQVLYCPSYHDAAPLRGLTTTYRWSPSDDRFKPLRFRFSEIVRVRGGNAPVAVCEQHNPLFDLSKEPRWTKKKVIVARLSGAVQVRQVPVRSLSPDY
jgi:prepilin-type N-terminal cleavage/methylation domain-containing protein